MDGEAKLTGDALVFLRRWKDSHQYEQDFHPLPLSLPSLTQLPIRDGHDDEAGADPPSASRSRSRIPIR